MNTAIVYQAGSMLKNLTTLRQSLDKCDGEDQDAVEIDDTEHDVNDKMEECIQKIFIYKGKNKEREREKRR